MVFHRRRNTGTQHIYPTGMQFTPEFEPWAEEWGTKWHHDSSITTSQHKYASNKEGANDYRYTMVPFMSAKSDAEDLIRSPLLSRTQTAITASILGGAIDAHILVGDITIVTDISE
jgi:hypothetical protein